MKSLQESILGDEQEIQQQMDDAANCIDNAREFSKIVESFISREGLLRKFNSINRGDKAGDFVYVFNMHNGGRAGLSFTVYYYGDDPGLYFYMTYWTKDFRIVYDVFGDYEIGGDGDESFQMRSDCEGAMACYRTLQSVFNALKYVADNKSKISPMIIDDVNKFYPSKWNSIIKMIKRAS